MKVKSNIFIFFIIMCILCIDFKRGWQYNYKCSALYRLTRWGVVKEEIILMDPMMPRDTNELREKILFVLDVTIRILIIVCLIVMIAMIIKGKIL